MERHPDIPDDLLLDFHLERLTSEQQERVRRALDQSEELAARHQRLSRLLAPLDHWSAGPVPSDLPERVLAYVRSRTPAVERPAVASEGRRLIVPSGSWFRFREMLAAAACVALLVGVVVPGLSNVRERSRRALCAANLHRLSGAVSAYQASFNGSIPYAGYVPNSAWLASAPANHVYASNSRHLFLLLRGGFGARPADFICPSDTEARPMRPEDIETNDDFASACNVSYNSLNLAAARPHLRPAPIVAYLSDPNPLFERARFKAGVDPDTTNSPVHRGRGQTVLTMDGSARWTTTPIYGPRKDNLWLVGNIRTYTGCEAPTRDDDAQLIPGYPARECNRVTPATR